VNSRYLQVLVLTLALMSLSACSSLQRVGHEYLMSGQVVEVSGNEVVLCIGSGDGAKVSQELTAYKLVPTNAGGPKNATRWERVKVGSVRVAQVIDEHFAKAQVTSGEVKVHDVVELVP